MVSTRVSDSSNSPRKRVRKTLASFTISKQEELGFTLPLMMTECTKTRKLRLLQTSKLYPSKLKPRLSFED